MPPWLRGRPISPPPRSARERDVTGVSKGLIVDTGTIVSITGGEFVIAREKVTFDSLLSRLQAAKWGGRKRFQTVWLVAF